MGGSISSLLDISRRSLNNASQAIRVVGNNIANASNEAYSRREVIFKDIVSTNTGDSSFGMGADIDRVVRRVDDFVNSLHRGTVSDKAAADVRYELLNRAEDPFSVDRTLRHVGYELGEYFSALQSLELNPADNALRSNFLEAGQNLTQAIRLTYTHLSGLQREADNRLGFAVEEVNSITTRIAELNGQIAASEVSEQQNLGLRDERDKLLSDLSKKLSVSVIEDSNKQVTVSLANGFALVNGTTARPLEFTKSPSFGTFPAGLDGGPLGVVVWDADSTATTSHVNLQNIIAAGGGEIAGLLQFRGVPQTTDPSPFHARGDMPDIASRIEAIALNLIVTHNNIYRPLDGALVASASPTGVAPAFAGLFGASGALADAPPFNGFVDAADLSAAGVGSFAQVISFTPTSPGELAFAEDENPAAGAVAFSPGNGGIARKLFAQRTQAFTFSVGNFTQTSTLNELYDNTVTAVGALTALAKNTADTSASKEAQLSEMRTAISGVNLDEELTKLISLQKTYQASARLIRTGDELLDTLLQAVGG